MAEAAPVATPNPESPAVSETPEPVTNPEQGTVTPPQEAPVEGKPIEARAGQDGKVYTGLTTEELITELQKRDSHLKSTIAETMQRKEKIRTMETEIGDNTRGMSGVALKIPETFAEFIALSTDKQKEIKEKYPAEFKKILKTMNP